MPFKKSDEDREHLSLGDEKKLKDALEGYIRHLDDEKKKLLQEATIKFISEQIKIEERKAKTFKKNPQAYQSSLEDIDFLKAFRSELRTKKLYNSKNSADLFTRYHDKLATGFKSGKAYVKYLADTVTDKGNIASSFDKKANAVTRLLELVDKKATKKELYETFKEIKPTLEERRGQSRFWKVIDKLLPRKVGVTGASLARSMHSQFYRIEKRDTQVEKAKKRFSKHS